MVAAGTVYLVLVSISGLAVVIVWMAIALSEINFRRQWLAQGHTVSELKFRTPGFPVVPWAALIMSLLSCVLIVFDPNQRSSLLYMLPFIALCYGFYYGRAAWRRRRESVSSSYFRAICLLMFQLLYGWSSSW